MNTQELYRTELGSVFRSPLFLIVLVLKILASFLFASKFITDYFIPFTHYFIASGGDNPYRHFLESGHPELFPYPALMLYIFSIPQAAFDLVSPAASTLASPLNLFLFRLPLFVADFVLFLVLLKWLFRYRKKIVLYYWASPILFYISYVHGQLDVIPILLLFLAFHFIFKEEWLISAVLLGLAVATKTNVLLAVPFYFVYLILKKPGWAVIALSAATMAATFVAVNAPFLFAPGLLQTVFENREQSKVLEFIVPFGPNFTYYLVPAVYVVLVLRSFSYKTFSRDIFLMYVGFAFCLITALIPPMPGWYFWTIPLLVYFYIKESSSHRFSFFLLNYLYFLFFAVSASDFPQVHQTLQSWTGQADTIVNLTLTVLQTTMVMNAFWMYRVGVASNVNVKLKNEPYFIGVGGDSGVGKTEVSQLLQGVFGSRNLLLVRGDDMHKWERGDANWKRFTHLNPKANRLHADLNQILELKNGKSIQRSRYDHGEGRFTSQTELRARNVVLVEGLHPFYIQKMREIFDLKIYLHPDENLRRHWKIQRDSLVRGQSVSEVLKNLQVREADAQRFIHPQEKYADIVISLQPVTPILEADSATTDPKLKLSMRFSNDVPFDSLLESLADCEELQIQHHYDFDSQVLEFSGSMTRAEVERIGFFAIPDLFDLNFAEPGWEPDLNGLIQLLTTFYIFEKLKISGAV